MQTPENFTAVPDGKRRVKLTWDTVPGAAGYAIFFSQTPGMNPTKLSEYGYIRITNPDNDTCIHTTKWRNGGKKLYYVIRALAPGTGTGLPHSPISEEVEVNVEGMKPGNIIAITISIVILLILGLLFVPKLVGFIKKQSSASGNTGALTLTAASRTNDSALIELRKQLEELKLKLAATPPAVTTNPPAVVTNDFSGLTTELTGIKNLLEMLLTNKNSQATSTTTTSFPGLTNTYGNSGFHINVNGNVVNVGSNNGGPTNSTASATNTSTSTDPVSLKEVVLDKDGAEAEFDIPDGLLVWAIASCDASNYVVYLDGIPYTGPANWPSAKKAKLVSKAPDQIKFWLTFKRK